MSNADYQGPGPAQGTAGLTDVVIQLVGVVRQMSSSNTLLQSLINTLSAIFPRITGSFTLAAAATTTVTQVAIKANSIVLWSPTNAAAGTLEGSPKKLYHSANAAGASFTVATASGVAAAGTETFEYTVINPS
jgi:hypothetical protein